MDNEFIQRVLDENYGGSNPNRPGRKFLRRAAGAGDETRPGPDRPGTAHGQLAVLRKEPPDKLHDRGGGDHRYASDYRPGPVHLGLPDDQQLGIRP